MFADVDAALYAKSSQCYSNTGKVISVLDNELFTIEICDEIKVFKEFSYCYSVEEGDAVLFDGNPDKCDIVSFTVMSNGVQCGVICP
jgi:hypothetical protein